MVLAKDRRGLTKTLIGKAVELRNSIPWANPSMFVLLEDPKKPGKKTVRPGARNFFVVLLLIAVAVGGVYVWQRPHEPQQHIDVFEVIVPPPEIKPLAPPPKAVAVEKPAPAPEPPPPPPAAAPAKPAAKIATGKLLVTATFKGKPVKDAVVRINGVNLGNTPVSAPVAAGRYTVKIDRAGFKSEKRPDVDIRAGKTRALNFELKK
jgi:hypothetical protein